MRLSKPTQALAYLFISTALAVPVEPAKYPTHDLPIFDCKPPVYKERLPTYSLGHALQFPEDTLQAIISEAAGGAKMNEREDDVGRYWYSGETLVGRFDKTTNETVVLPDLPYLKPGHIKLNEDLLRKLRGHPAIIASDKTVSSIVIGSRLDGSRQHFLGTEPSRPASYLLEGIIQRAIPYGAGTHPVCGGSSGSQAVFSFDVNGNIRGLRHAWKPASNQNTFLRPLTPDQIQARITEELVAAGLGSRRAVVRHIDLCFYDSGAARIQPVFRFNATISTVLGGPATALIVGYIPASEKGALEPLPNITTPDAGDLPKPDFPQTNPPGFNNTHPPNTTALLAPLPGPSRRDNGAITLGRYLMNGDGLSTTFIEEANGLWSGLHSTSSRFVNAQYYWDDPHVYDAWAYYYVNNVHVAFSDGHGSPHSFLTNGGLPGAGEVTISSDLYTKGFGASATTGGKLAYWILGECSVIPAPIDYPAGQGHLAFDPWWKVFNGGIRAAVGYRDLAYTNPPKWNEVGKTLGHGASVVHGFMSTMLPTGKTSAITRCGRDGDNIYQVSGLSKPDCLTIWWYN